MYYSKVIVYCLKQLCWFKLKCSSKIHENEWIFFNIFVIFKDNWVKFESLDRSVCEDYFHMWRIFVLLLEAKLFCIIHSTYEVLKKWVEGKFFQRVKKKSSKRKNFIWVNRFHEICLLPRSVRLVKFCFFINEKRGGVLWNLVCLKIVFFSSDEYFSIS